MGPKVNMFRDIHLPSCAGTLWVLHKMFEWMWERICLFPADVALCAILFGYMEVDDSEMFLDTDALPHVHCHWHDRTRSECLPSQQTCSLCLHHESNTSTHFNCSQLSTSSDGLYDAAVCSRDTAYALLIGYELLHTLPYAKHYSLFITAFLGFLHSSGYFGTCSLLDPCW